MRRRHLAALAREVEARGLAWRFAGPGESLLAVYVPGTGRHVIVLATPCGDGWYYLWPAGAWPTPTAPPRWPTASARFSADPALLPGPGVP
ncbi:hypothetical protein ACFQY7_27110 [Actinomadura luteofluorescens]|uniref:hypothetical protein n=1 Tax=Actinomadura luteofluorescens TaxID=46163 RepID=UPI00362D61EC